MARGGPVSNLWIPAVHARGENTDHRQRGGVSVVDALAADGAHAGRLCRLLSLSAPGSWCCMGRSGSSSPTRLSTIPTRSPTSCSTCWACGCSAHSLRWILETRKFYEFYFWCVIGAALTTLVVGAFGILAYRQMPVQLFAIMEASGARPPLALRAESTDC